MLERGKALEPGDDVEGVGGVIGFLELQSWPYPLSLAALSLSSLPLPDPCPLPPLPEFLPA